MVALRPSPPEPEEEEEEEDDEDEEPLAREPSALILNSTAWDWRPYRWREE